MKISKKVKTLISHPIQPTISICFLIQCTYWKIFVIIYLTQRDLFFIFYLLNLISFRSYWCTRGRIWNAISVKSWNFMLNGREFLIERSRFSCWTVQIFMINDWDFHVEQSRFLWRTVQIFMMNGPDFHNDRWWQVEIFIMTGPKLLCCFGLNLGARGEHLVIQLLAFVHVLVLST